MPWATNMTWGRTSPLLARPWAAFGLRVARLCGLEAGSPSPRARPSAWRVWVPGSLGPATPRLQQRLGAGARAGAGSSPRTCVTRQPGADCAPRRRNAIHSFRGLSATRLDSVLILEEDAAATPGPQPREPPTPQRPVICSRCSGYRAPSTRIFEAARSISARSSGVSSTSAAPRFSSRRSSFVVPGIGTIHGLGEQPGERDLRGCRTLAVSDHAEEVDQSLVRLKCLRSEAWEPGPEVAAVERRVRVHLPREDPSRAG